MPSCQSTECIKTVILTWHRCEMEWNEMKNGGEMVVMWQPYTSPSSRAFASKYSIEPRFLLTRKRCHLAINTNQKYGIPTRRMVWNTEPSGSEVRDSRSNGAKARDISLYGSCVSTGYPWISLSVLCPCIDLHYSQIYKHAWLRRRMIRPLLSYAL
jgi:hypothetical protein